MANTPSVNKIDALMGRVLRNHRIFAGATQKQLARNSRISFQQIQKYESGANRISISRLFEVSDALGAKPSELITAVEDLLPHAGQSLGEKQQAIESTIRSARFRAFQSISSIEDKSVLETICTLIELLNKQNDARQLNKSFFDQKTNL